MHYEKRDPRDDCVGMGPDCWPSVGLLLSVLLGLVDAKMDGASDLFLALNRSRTPDIRNRVAGLRLPKGMIVVWLTCGGFASEVIGLRETL